MIIRGELSSDSINLNNTNNMNLKVNNKIGNSIKFNSTKQGDSLEISNNAKIMYGNMKISSEELSKKAIEVAKPFQAVKAIHNSLQRVAVMGIEEAMRIDKGEGDQAKYNLLVGIANDINKMEGKAYKYYKEHGTLDSVLNEELSQGTSMIEYKDIALIQEVSKELAKIDKENFKSDLEYYDAVLEKLFDSKLSDKAKKSIGGYVEGLKKEFIQTVELTVEDSLSVKEIEKKLARIKENMDKDNVKMDWKELLKLNKQFTNIYLIYND